MAQQQRFETGDTLLQNWQSLAMVFPDQIDSFVGEKPTGTQISFGNNQFATAKRLYRQGASSFQLQISDYARDSAALTFLFESQSPWIQTDTVTRFPLLLHQDQMGNMSETHILSHVRYHLDLSLPTASDFPSTADVLQSLNWDILDTKRDTR
ncbi:MAG: hypothetical protein AAFR59_12610 [Bacteroidota bacterium]